MLRKAEPRRASPQGKNQPAICRVPRQLWQAAGWWSNSLGFRLRQTTHWRRRGYVENPEGPGRLDAEEAALLEQARGHDLAERYGLHRYRARLAQRTWQVNLILADLLDQIRRNPPREDQGTTATASAFHVLDIGSKNFEYAPALYNVLQTWTGQPVTMTGLEIDPWRVYSNLHSRWDAAHYYLHLLPGERESHRYLAADLLGHQAPQCYDLITWFHPFLTEFPLKKWGLPKTLLQPQPLLEKGLSLLKPAGCLLIVNQNGREARLQSNMLKRAPVEVHMQSLQSKLTPTTTKRWCFLITKPH